MTRSKRDMRRLGVIANWVSDSFGTGDVASDMDHRHARDLIKFLKANGWEVKECTLDYQEDDEIPVDTLYLVKSSDDHQEIKPSSA